LQLLLVRIPVELFTTPVAAVDKTLLVVSVAVDRT
jgi:hypothetical protein